MYTRQAVIISEHTAIPADVLNAAIGIILQPIGRTTRHVEFAVGIVCRAVLTGFVVIPRAVYGAVVLSDMEVDGPRAKSVCHLLVGGPKLFVRIPLLEKRVLWGVVT